MFKLSFGKLKFAKVKADNPVVVEIGNDWVKIAEFRPSQPGTQGLVSLSLQKLAQIKESIPVTIDKVFKDLSLPRHSVTLCIPRHLITVRVLDLPSTNPAEINDMINLQVGKQTPYSKDSIVSAYKSMPGARGGYTKVMLAVAHRNILNERIETLKNAGIHTSKVCISSEGVYNWFSLSYAQEIKPSESDTVALLDIDSNYSDFIAIRNGRMVFTKNLFIGANNLADRSEPWTDRLIEELKRCVKRFYIEERNTRISKIYLTGAVKNIESLDAMLPSALDMAVEKTDTFKGVGIKEGIVSGQEAGLKFVSLTSLIGAGMKSSLLELDLTPGEQKIQNAMERRRKDLTVMGILFVSIITVMTFFLMISFYYKSMYLAQLKKEVARISGESGDLEKKRLGIELVKRNLDAEGSSLSTLHEIYSITPPEIYFRGIDIDENRQVILKGYGFVMSDVFKYIKKLEESKLFANVKASYTRTKKEKEGDRDVEYAEFEIVCPVSDSR